MTFALWDKNMFSDFNNKVYGAGHLALPVTSGEKKVELTNSSG